MVINLNNSHINSFIKGMNSDLAYDQIGNDQYTFGQNIRITKNLLIGQDGRRYPLLHEGVITPVIQGIPINGEDILELLGLTIIAVDSVDDLGIIITKDDNNIMFVYKIKINADENILVSFRKIWECSGILNKDIKLISAVLYKELENVVKLYIATGIVPIISFRVDDESISPDVDGVNYLFDGQQYSNVDILINNRIIPLNPIRINSITGGQLKTSQVLYTYRYYNKYGNTTQLAPLTNKILVINASRAKETGNAENTETSIGFELNIVGDENAINYSRMQIFRLSYIKPREDAEVSLIYDGEKKSKFVDVGAISLQLYTMEEFAAMSGLIIVPKIIEKNQEYMFAANVTDDTIIRGVTVDKNKSHIKPVTATVVLSEAKIDATPNTIGELYKDSNYSEIVDGDNNHITNVPSYLNLHNINSELLGKSTYNDIITSSLLRSLRRDETYKYAIVYYDKYGRRSDVIPIGEVEVPYTESAPFVITDEKVCAKPIGISITVPQPLDQNGNLLLNVVGCLIVRRSSSEIYQKTLLQVVLASPISQSLYTTTELDSKTQSPHYPSGFLTTDNIHIGPGYYGGGVAINFLIGNAGSVSDDQFGYLNIFENLSEKYDYEIGNNNDIIPTHKDLLIANNIGAGRGKLFLLFSSEIDYIRNNVLLTLLQNNISIKKIYKTNIPINNISEFNEYLKTVLSITNDIYSASTPLSNAQHSDFILNFPSAALNSNGGYVLNAINELYIDRRTVFLDKNSKISEKLILNYIDSLSADQSEIEIKNIKDVKIPNWEDGFSNLQYDMEEPSKIRSGIKLYKQYTTNIDEFTYCNWISFGKYDLRISGKEDVPNMSTDNGGEYILEYTTAGNILKRTYIEGSVSGYRISELSRGYIGPGPSCFIATTAEDLTTVQDSSDRLSTYICNITHKNVTSDAEPDEYIQYFGFGNYFKLKLNDNGTAYIVDNGSTNSLNTMIVFDGDIYITMHELTTMYKTYGFESRGDALLSLQITNYVPLESKVNTYFDYGMNYLNTNSTNLLYEPGKIEGVVGQDRPAHQYNMIYSDNDVSNDVFTLVSTDINETNEFKLRTYFSEPKTNGEFIDNFLIYKPASFIDVDSQYGQITNLFTDKNVLYYWQDHAFGKFSVNERSLINDQNGNTIMLGQAGILSRYDYVSTKYGMRLQDFCACTAEQGVYWVDINNKAIVAGSTGQVVNYGEQLGVQNIINNRIIQDIPKVDYDLQNNELLFRCLADGQQLVINSKYNIATSLYTRQYDDILYIKNHIYGLCVNDDKLDIEKHNYITFDENTEYSYLSPIKFSFVVNPSASVTKVYDSQQIIPIKRDKFTAVKHILDEVNMSFETDIVDRTEDNLLPYTDREGNIIYNIPRHNNENGYGSRIRGKWLDINILNNNPSEWFVISHIITKFRLSFS